MIKYWNTVWGEYNEYAQWRNDQHREDGILNIWPKTADGKKHRTWRKASLGRQNFGGAPE